MGAQFSIPVRMRPIRFLFASRPLITGQVLGIVYRVISMYLVKKAGYSQKTARPGTQLPTRHARGPVAEVDNADLHEAAFWHNYFRYKEQPDLAASYLNRYENLRRSMGKN